MDRAELDQLVAAISETLLARLRGGEESLCPDCGQFCAQFCPTRTQAIIAAGADRVTAAGEISRIDPRIAALIDHTLLKPEATADDVRKLCAEARRYHFASVCVNPYWVPLVTAELAGSDVKVCTVVGFPLGANMTEIKQAEAVAAIQAGAQEVDMVQNVGALRGGDFDAVKNDIQAVAGAAHRGGAILKVILETALLDDNQKAIACTLAKLAGADFVKTSTGFSSGGATAHDIALMRLVAGPEMGVKASGGVRTLDDLKKMTAAGASRIGASASVKIIEATAA
jgi:deoxyribose-phosphate aldolase